MKNFFMVTILIFGIFFCFSPNLVFAQSLTDQVTGQLDAGARGGELGEAKDPRIVIAEIIKVALTLTGTVFMGLVLYAGYLMLVDRGNEDSMEKAKKTMTQAVIGLFVVLAAYSITLFVGKAIQQNVSGQDYVNQPKGIRVKCPITKLLKGECPQSGVERLP